MIPRRAASSATFASGWNTGPSCGGSEAGAKSRKHANIRCGIDERNALDLGGEIEGVFAGKEE
jgi:hypothetical protein